MKRIEGQDIFNDSVAPPRVLDPSASSVRDGEIVPSVIEVIPDPLPEPTPIEERPVTGDEDLRGDDGQEEPEPTPVIETLDESFVEYGLILPTGETAWNQFGGNIFATPELRNQLFTRLQQTAVAAGFDPSEFLNRYSWTVRVVTAHIVRQVQPSSGEFNVADPRVLTQQFQVEGP
jgi:hypothetical protein